MSKSEWQDKLADFMPLYEAGAYTVSEFFWFALPLFDGGEDDKELWGVLPKQVQERFSAEMDSWKNWPQSGVLLCCNSTAGPMATEGPYLWPPRLESLPDSNLIDGRQRFAHPSNAGTE